MLSANKLRKATKARASANKLRQATKTRASAISRSKSSKFIAWNRESFDDGEDLWADLDPEPEDDSIEEHFQYSVINILEDEVEVEERRWRSVGNNSNKRNLKGHIF